MLAGLPKAPSAYNPVINPTRARLRQQYVLRRMNELGFISAEQQEAALAQALVIKREVNEIPVHAEYVTEMARQIAAERFPDDVYTRGLRVYTTILKNDQEAAYNRLRRGVLEYDRRHGYRGAEAYVDLNEIKSEQDEGRNRTRRSTNYCRIFRMRKTCIRRSSCRSIRARSAPTAVAVRW